jgi:hypothetical protein
MQLGNGENYMSLQIRLACEPKDLPLTMGTICAHLQNGKAVAQVQETDGSITFRPTRFLDDFPCFDSKPQNEKAGAVQEAFDRYLIRGKENLQQAYRDIASYPSSRTAFYEQFFSLHLFRKDHQKDLQFLPLIYLKLRQATGNFEEVLESMKPRLCQLRKKAWIVRHTAHDDEYPDIYFVSAEGMKVYAHRQWLTQLKVVRDLAPQRSKRPMMVTLPLNSRPSFRILNLFVDILYGARELKIQFSDDLEAIYNLADSLKCEKLRDAAYKYMQIAIRREVRLKELLNSRR